MRKGISILISAVFIVALMTSSLVSSVKVAGAPSRNTDDFLYSVSVSPTLDRVNQGDFGTYDVQVSRGSDAGQFSVLLSLDASSSNVLRTAVTFNPPILNFEQGQTAVNSTLKINSRELASGSFKFRVESVTQGSGASDRAFSNPVALIVGAADRSATHSSNTLSKVETAGGVEQRQAPETKTNNPPIAKAGQDQVTKEGDKVLLDGTASTDPDKDTLSYSWDQLSPRQPTAKLDTSDVASKVGLLTPDVDRDTIFRFKLVVRDGSGGTSADSVNILVKNVEESTSTSIPPQAQIPPAAEQSPKSSQGTENHSPTAVTIQTIFANDGNPSLAISLKGNDPDKDDSLTFVTTSAPSHGTIAGFDKSSGSLTYLPNVGFTGKDGFKFKVIDNNGAESNEASVVINVGEEVNKKSSTTTASAANTSKAVEDRLNQRQEILDAKLKETRGEKIANQYIVVLKSALAPTDTQSLVNDAKARGAKVLQQYQEALKGITINIPDKESLAAILNDSDVAYAEPDVRVKAFTQTIPSGIDRVDADLSSAISGDGKGDVINADIAILDTGIDLTHADLNVYKHVSFVPGTATASTGNDDHGHGTMVAGVAAAKDNDWGSVGVAPGVRLWSVKVLDSTGTGSLSSVLEGLDFVTSNAKELEVADMSFGCENCSSATLDAAIHNAVTAGVTIVAAAGNGAKDASTFSPANHPDVIAVSAIADSDGKCGGQGSSTSAGADDTVASFSNFGPAIDMAAPGVQIYSTTKNGGYSIASGTSMAAPHVAGAAALYMSENPNASPSQVLPALKSQGSIRSNYCDDKGQGYFTNDKDNSKEPLLYVGIARSATPEIPAVQSNNTSSNTSANATRGEIPETPSSAPPTNATNANNNGTNTTLTAPVSGNVTGSIGNSTGIGNQTSGNQTLGNQTFHAASGDTWYLSKKIGEGILSIPHGVDVDPDSGKIYVADTGNHRIAAFNPDGTLDTTFDTDGFAGSYGSLGPEDIVFMPSYPVSGGTTPVLIVTEPSNPTPAIDFYTPTGTLIQHTTGTDLGMTMPGPRPTGIGAGLSAPGFYVVDSTHKEVVHIDPSVSEVPGSLHPFPPLITNPGFFSPVDVACCLLPTGTSPDSVYVVDANLNGPGITAYRANPDHSFVFGCCNDRVQSGVDVIRGATSSNWRIIVSDQNLQEVDSYTADGTFAAQVAPGGSDDGEVMYPTGISVVPDPHVGGETTDTIYVADQGNNRVQVFVNTQPASPDTIPPTVLSTEPAGGDTNVPVNSIIKATFSEPMNADTVNEETFNLVGSDGIEGTFPVEGTVELIDEGFTATFTPTASLTPDTTFSAQIKGDCSPCVEDLAGNSMGSDFSWSFDTGAAGAAEISMTLDPALPKWGHEVTAQGTVTGAGEDDKISIDWGDDTAFTEISPVPEGGEFTATHVYDISAATIPEKTVVAKLLTTGDELPVERARVEVSTTIQKHATSLTLGMNPSPDSPVCSDCHFTAVGKLVDVETQTETTTFPSEIAGKTITFSGSGASTLDSVPTEGLTFTGDSNNNLTLTSSVLRMHVGSQVDLTYSGVSASGVTLDFSGASGSSVGVTLTKAVAPFDTVSVNVPVGSPQNIAFAKGFSKLAITSIDGSSSPSEFAELATIITYDAQAEGEQFQVEFSNNVGTPQDYATLVIQPGSYFSAGVTQGADANGLKITAQFDGTADPAYSGATSPELSYNVDSSAAGTGTGDTTPDDTTVWTKLNVGSGTAAGDVCTFNGVAGTDNDKDNICDRWEDPTGATRSPGNDATHRYVICPTTAGHAAAIDPQCPITPGQVPTIKYNLCNPICPTLNKKDIYVEIDSKTGFVPTTTAINNVIRAFANAPNGGITLHVRTDEAISSIPNNLFAWKDPASLNFNDNVATNDFFNIKKTNFGTAAERGGTSGMPGMTTAAWSSTGKTLKHYFTHYGLSVNFYSRTSGQTCPAGGLSSGVGELLGNDFIVSLGCGWGTFGDNARSNAQQAGTIMHELGHNIGLHHGGPAKIVVGSRTTSDYNMNCKPNYLSVMNYARQLPWDLVGVSGVGTDDIAIWEGDKLADGTYNYGQDAAKYSTMLDYSRTTLPNQNEASINEAAGTTAADGKKYRIVYVKTTPGTVAVGTDGANFDFSGNGLIAAIPGDINSVGSKVAGCGPLAPEIENSYNDWNEINLVFLPDPDSQDGVTQRVSDPYTGIIEVTPSFAATIAAKAHGLQVQFIPPPNTDGSSIFNTGSIVPLKFRLTDKDGNFIRNAAVTFVAEKASTPCTTCTGTFVYNRAQEQYQFDWKTPKTAQAKGQWTISYFIDYQTPNQVLLQGPQAQASGGLFTLKVTGK